MAERRFEQSAAAQISIERFKGVTTTEEATVSIGTSVGELAAADPERVMLTLANLSSAPMNVAPTNQVSTTRSLVLSPGGGTLIVTVDQDAELVTRSWHGIGGIASAAVYRIEVRRHVGVGEGV